MQIHFSTDQIAERLADLPQSPQENGTLEMIVCRPSSGERLVMESAELDLIKGLIGDNWQTRGSKRTEDGTAHPEMQIAIVNSRVIQAIASDRERWSLAGDQLIVDLDLSVDNLPPGQQLAIGAAVLEVTHMPHTGCQKFTERFGHEAIRFVNSPEGQRNRHRGMYARVIQPGTIKVGDSITKITKSISTK